MTDEHAIHEHELVVPRTARMAVVGGGGALDEAWFVLHGYGQLAAAFLEDFVPFASKHRRIVAPEGLSRFYLRGSNGSIGASWMTREARRSEIADQLLQLEAVRHETTAAHHDVPVKVLGFSQGAATACRWIARAEFAVERLVLWGSAAPPDHTPDELARLKKIDLVFVVGRSDRYFDEDRVREELERMKRDGLRPRVVRFDGGHQLDREVLADVLA